jgi:hypothetical protein
MKYLGAFPEKTLTQEQARELGKMGTVMFIMDNRVCVAYGAKNTPCLGDDPLVDMIDVYDIEIDHRRTRRKVEETLRQWPTLAVKLAIEWGIIKDPTKKDQ